MQVGPHGGGVTFHASSQLVAICIATAQWVFVGCDFSTSPDPCNPEDGVVVIVDRGVLEQNACSQDIGSDQHSSDGLSGYVDVEITNSDHFDSVEPAYDGYVKSVRLLSVFQDGDPPSMQQWIDLTEGSGGGWELSFLRDDDGYATVHSGLLIVEFTSEPASIHASFESLDLEWTDGDAEVVDGTLDASLEIHCWYCTDSECADGTTERDSWPPTSNYCQELEAALLGS